MNAEIDFSIGVPTLLIATAFFVGSIPFGVLIARFFKVKDLNRLGSGNVGATNVSRVLGFWPAGFLTFAFDVGKGSISVFLATDPAMELWVRLLGGISDPSGFTVSQSTTWACALFAVLGHCYSPWLRFNGGKGVATGFGAILALSPWAALAGAIGFCASFYAKRISSLASIVGLASASMAYLVSNRLEAHLWSGAAMIFVILIRHEKNVDALLSGNERKF